MATVATGDRASRTGSYCHKLSLHELSLRVLRTSLGHLRGDSDGFGAIKDSLEVAVCKIRRVSPNVVTIVIRRVGLQYSTAISNDWWSSPSLQVSLRQGFKVAASSAPSHERLSLRVELNGFFLEQFRQALNATESHWQVRPEAI